MWWVTLFSCVSAEPVRWNDLLPDTPVDPDDAATVSRPVAGASPLVARLTADVVSGAFPLQVSFDATASDLGAGPVRREWTFGDGADAVGGDRVVHTFVGEGTFAATVTLVDPQEAISTAEVTIEVSRPSCPQAAPAVTWGAVEDHDLEELSGLVASRVDPTAFWVHEDSGNTPVLTAIDSSGATLSRHELPDRFADFEDLAAAVDPETGVPTLFLGDIGDNGQSRGEIVVWVVDEPHPDVDGPLEPLAMHLTYPDGARNAETLLVDPVTFDLYLVTKGGNAGVYVKRAPHDAEGPFELEALGEPASLALTATGGDVSPDGSRVVVRDYTETARLWIRDGYLPLEDAFDAEPCAVAIHPEQQGEAIAFTAGGLVTVSEGVGPSLYYIGL